MHASALTGMTEKWNWTNNTRANVPVIDEANLLQALVGGGIF